MGKFIQENWNSRMGAILAVAGSAVGLGNFLRFPGQVAQYGGGAFMLAYVISFLLIGLPICWAEWTMGRYGGRRGFFSCVGIMHAVTKHPMGKYLGVLGIVIPVIIYMYYVVIEAWCLGYSFNFLMGNAQFSTAAEAEAFFVGFTGLAGDGSAMGFGASQVGFFLLFCFILNFVLIYRGVSKGIEFFCKFAMPALIVLAVIVLIRVLTLGTPDASQPQNSIINGLGFMWNPNKVVVDEFALSPDGLPGELIGTTEVLGRSFVEEARARAELDPALQVREITIGEQLKRPGLWLAAAGQIFFSLSVGFGIILTYASYLRKEDDVVLSGLAATSANQFCEVALGGIDHHSRRRSLPGRGQRCRWHLCPWVYGFTHGVLTDWPGAPFSVFFSSFLLFLAAVTSSLSMLQPGIAFLESALRINRKQSVAILGFITAVGCMFVVYFSGQGLKALDTLDFWVGTFMIYILATIQIVVFSWVFGIRKGLQEAAYGAQFSIPALYGWIMKFITPVFLLTIFFFWLTENIFRYNPLTGQRVEGPGALDQLIGANANIVAQLSVLLIILFAVFVTIIVNSSSYYKTLSHTEED
ncbi:MAG: sodium-dependent transporter [Verrucomicrobia bacterium]|nr:sodium-dependent transporter [Verrucomicrobiota bacterium]